MLCCHSHHACCLQHDHAAVQDCLLPQASWAHNCALSSLCLAPCWRPADTPCPLQLQQRMEEERLQQQQQQQMMMMMGGGGGDMGSGRGLPQQHMADMQRASSAPMTQSMRQQVGSRLAGHSAAWAAACCGLGAAPTQAWCLPTSVLAGCLAADGWLLVCSWCLAPQLRALLTSCQHVTCCQHQPPEHTPGQPGWQHCLVGTTQCVLCCTSHRR